MVAGMELSAEDRKHLLRAIALSDDAREAGNRPYGAVLVDSSGRVLGESTNIAGTSGDPTAHAEMAVLRSSGARLDRETLAGSTIYASGEPCAMCAAAICLFGIRRVVFGIDEAAIHAYRERAGESAGMRISCRDMFARGGAPTEVIGPALLEQARRPHDLFWGNATGAADKKD